MSAPGPAGLRRRRRPRGSCRRARAPGPRRIEIVVAGERGITSSCSAARTAARTARCSTQSRVGHAVCLLGPVWTGSVRVWNQPLQPGPASVHGCGAVGRHAGRARDGGRRRFVRSGAVGHRRQDREVAGRHRYGRAGGALRSHHGAVVSGAGAGHRWYRRVLLPVPAPVAQPGDHVPAEHHRTPRAREPVGRAG